MSATAYNAIQPSSRFTEACPISRVAAAKASSFSSEAVLSADFESKDVAGEMEGADLAAAVR